MLGCTPRWIWTLALTACATSPGQAPPSLAATHAAHVPDAGAATAHADAGFASAAQVPVVTCAELCAHLAACSPAGATEGNESCAQSCDAAPPDVAARAQLLAADCAGMDVLLARLAPGLHVSTCRDLVRGLAGARPPSPALATRLARGTWCVGSAGPEPWWVDGPRGRFRFTSEAILRADGDTPIGCWRLEDSTLYTMTNGAAWEAVQLVVHRLGEHVWLEGAGQTYAECVDLPEPNPRAP